MVENLTTKNDECQEMMNVVRRRVAADFDQDLVAHDMGHLDRVWLNCKEIIASDGGNPLVLCAASYLHDYHRVLERQREEFVRPQEALDQVNVVLGEIEFPILLRPRVVSCVAATGRHTFSGDALAKGLEERILHDADTLDAMGAIGVARAFMFGGLRKEPLWRPSIPVSERYVPGRSNSVVHHFYEKLLRLVDDMETDAGRKLALERHEFMTSFLRQLAGDLGVESLV